MLIIPNLRLYETVLREALGAEDEMKRAEAEMVLKAIVGVLKGLKEEQHLLTGVGTTSQGSEPDEMEITNGDDGDTIGEVLRKRLSDKIGEVTAEEIYKLGKKDLVLAILDSAQR